jgi:hypothetical protein
MHGSRPNAGVSRVDNYFLNFAASASPVRKSPMSEPTATNR